MSDCGWRDRMCTAEVAESLVWIIAASEYPRRAACHRGEYAAVPQSRRCESPVRSRRCRLRPDSLSYRAGRDLQRLERTGHTGSFGSKQHVGVLTAVTAPLPYPRAAIQTRPSATSAPLHSVLPSTITPEPHQTALATELVAICSAWSALDTQGPLAASNTLAYSPR